MPSHTKGAGPSHWSRVGARVLDTHIDFFKENRLTKMANLFFAFLRYLREII